MNTQKTSKLTLVPLILMIFTSVFGFANIPRSFYLMGYAAIPWYILAGITFFIPFAFMMAEYGAAFKDEKGGIYSWMEKSTGTKYAFIVTFMWYASYIILMVNVISTIWIPLSNLIFGKDTTATWTLFGLNSIQTIGLLGALWMILVTIIASKGIEKVSKITSIGGTAVAILNLLLLLGALVVLIKNGGRLAQTIISAKTFVKPPNSHYDSPISMLSFMVFAIFAYGGIEMIGGLVDQTENPEVTFPKGVTIAAVVITIGYSLGIFLCGIFTNWKEVLSSDKVHMGNVAYVVMQNLGYQMGKGFGLTQNTSLLLGSWVARFVGLSMFLALTGALFTLTYSPLKQLIEGTPSEIWPKKIGEVKKGIPVNAMKVQCITIVVIVLLVSFGGEGASKFFSKIVLMTNVAITLPLIFIAAAFTSFKKKTYIKKPFEVFKNYTSALVASRIVIFVVGFANFFTIIEPITRGDIQSSIWMIAGPLFFIIVALVIYSRYEKKNKEQLKDEAV